MLRCENSLFMAKAKALRPRATALSGWRLAVIYTAMLAFALQSYVLQTHIHFAPATALADTSGANGHHDKYPANDDPANCPICQEILHHGGQFITPSAQFLLPPTLAVSTIAVVDQALSHILAPSHSWRGRAPPHA
jgi:hypothetical protein